jgi:hypothetical protein
MERDIEPTPRDPATLVGGGGTVLVLASGRADYRATDPGTAASLYVTTDGRAGAIDDAGPAREPGRFGHVEAGAGGTRSAAGTDPTPAGAGTEPVGPGPGDGAGVGTDWFSRVADPTDLPTVARHVDTHLDRLRGDGAGVRLYFDSLDPYVGTDAVAGPALFRFLHVVTSRVRSAGGFGQFYLDPARDEEFARSLEPLFDAVVEPASTGDGAGWDYRAPSPPAGTAPRYD